MAYLLDANIFIQGKKLHYGFDFCPAFWDWLDASNVNGTVFSIEKVRDELLAGNDDLSTWAQARGKAFFLPPDSSTSGSLAAVSTWASSGSYEPTAISTFLQTGRTGFEGGDHGDWVGGGRSGRLGGSDGGWDRPITDRDDLCAVDGPPAVRHLGATGRKSAHSGTLRRTRALRSRSSDLRKLSSTRWG
jgi:Domain of unknown function (DUF4411)